MPIDVAELARNLRFAPGARTVSVSGSSYRDPDRERQAALSDALANQLAVLDRQNSSQLSVLDRQGANSQALANLNNAGLLQRLQTQGDINLNSQRERLNAQAGMQQSAQMSREKIAGMQIQGQKDLSAQNYKQDRQDKLDAAARALAAFRGATSQLNNYNLAAAKKSVGA